MSTIQLTPDLYTLIDEAGSIDSEVKRLTAQLETLKAQIKAKGAGDFGGFSFAAKVSTTERETVDWKSVAQRLEPSRQLIAAHTNRAEVTSIKFSKI